MRNLYAAASAAARRGTAAAWVLYAQSLRWAGPATGPRPAGRGRAARATAAHGQGGRPPQGSVGSHRLRGEQPRQDGLPPLPQARTAAQQRAGGEYDQTGEPAAEGNGEVLVG